MVTFILIAFHMQIFNSLSIKHCKMLNIKIIPYGSNTSLYTQSCIWSVLTLGSEQIISWLSSEG